MGLDMYAFSLERSAVFTKPRDILNYRAPAEGKALPTGAIFLGMDAEMFAELTERVGPQVAAMMGHPLDSSPSLDVGSHFTDSKYVLPGSTLIHRWRKHYDLNGWMERRWNAAQWHKKAGALNPDARVPLCVQQLDDLEHAVRHGRLPKMPGSFPSSEEEVWERAMTPLMSALSITSRKDELVDLKAWWTSAWLSFDFIMGERLAGIDAMSCSTVCSEKSMSP